MRVKLPKNGTTRIVNKFAFSPTLVQVQGKDEYYEVWLEFYQEEQEYSNMIGNWGCRGMGYITEPREKKE